eukprot:CAMPEP_0170479904 /NCGR_PEP_ID=MMETSP0208-20121228/947_1 /TAXON_ID=197538 /ORGANISM="Strombidium inclinatum, Strain S3" /LENGTH=68 /DNA_ID=CAMNT_0010752365 /DNA_START=2743 /DNA_END=2949 /DNA_ORIENTATION=+
MSNFTNKLTNGIFVPTFQLHQYDTEQVLASLSQYLQDFVREEHAKARAIMAFGERRAQTAHDQVADVR